MLIIVLIMLIVMYTGDSKSDKLEEIDDDDLSAPKKEKS
jgi:hypothetical protein